MWYSVKAVSLPGKWFKTEPYFIKAGTVILESRALFVEQCLALCAQNPMCVHASFDINSTVTSDTSRACKIYSAHSQSQMLTGVETLKTFSPH